MATKPAKPATGVPIPQESHLRSLVKAVTWRAGGTLATALIAFVVTREWGDSLAIGGLDLVVKIAMFYGHERLWMKIPFGQQRAPDYEI